LRTYASRRSQAEQSSADGGTLSRSGCGPEPPCPDGGSNFNYRVQLTVKTV